MTDKSPEVLATANLTPISPAPLHLSSPVVVPALQDQADSLYTMSLSNGVSQDPTVPATAGEQVEPPRQNGAPTTDSQHETYGTQNAISTNNTENADDIDDLDDLQPDDEDDGAIVKNDSAALGGDGRENANQDVIKTNISAINSDSSESFADNSDGVDSASDHSSANPQIDPRPQSQTGITSSTNNTDVSQAATTAPTESNDHLPSTTSNEVDIQSLVDKIIGNAPTAAIANPIPTQEVLLPPRPPVPQQPSSAYVQSEDIAHTQYQPTYSNTSATMSSLLPPPPGNHLAGAPGTIPDAHNSHPPPPAAYPLNALPTHPFPVAQFDPAYAAAPGTQPQIIDQQPLQRWETFLQEERRYVSEAKWDRFPEGSRLFIGNLSSDRVSKKEVFDLFSKYGRLAQISLKQAYGFVQYHNKAEGQAAMDHLQGLDVRGRRIHLEFSRTQKKEGEGDKRGNRNKRDNDRHEGTRGRRDDYRPSRQPSPRRASHHQQSSYDGGRDYYDDYSSRGRSRSPGYGRRDSGHYRRRSPSPYRRHPSEADLDIPRRYGAEVPDVQFILRERVEDNFIAWTERAFLDLQLKVQHMPLYHPYPQFPRDAIIQRQVVEGVHAVVELDLKAQRTGTISLQVFNRSGGRGSVQYDQYQDLDPVTAARLVLTRVKPQVPPQPQHPYGTQYPPAQYHPPPQPAYLPPSHSAQPYPSAVIPPAPTASAGGSLDDSTIQRILGTINGQQGAPRGYTPQPAGRAPDMNPVYTGQMGGNFSGPAAHNLPPNMGYPPVPANGVPGPSGGENSQYVDNIISQLARYRQ
ncbi:uncharacterized protein F4822DRAFT_357747 [Hypoxylon trugodes]|uniref:uncharacterized protein n=1 Tax=Hypoxylon trugodes TaxID=326681 RepID=UPI0021938954|nr:uncharacterized protein F4822DRAFT_357747 [Hypoxylon trugodes]KAI1385927.1 hypothetical protein F4822DRAFT_357747 [Hypoxylon trugodes]